MIGTLSKITRARGLLHIPSSLLRRSHRSYSCVKCSYGICAKGNGKCVIVIVAAGSSHARSRTVITTKPSMKEEESKGQPLSVVRPSVSRQVAGTAEVIVPKNKETDETTINGALVPNSEQH